VAREQIVPEVAARIAQHGVDVVRAVLRGIAEAAPPSMTSSTRSRAMIASTVAKPCRLSADATSLCASVGWPGPCRRGAAAHGGRPVKPTVPLGVVREVENGLRTLLLAQTAEKRLGSGGRVEIHRTNSVPD
jgi:hypothetical protein